MVLPIIIFSLQSTLCVLFMQKAILLLTVALACWIKCRGALPNSKAAPNQGIHPLMHGGAFG